VRRFWLLACSFAAVAWACDEKFPQQLSSPPPPALDAGVDATTDASAVVPKGSRTLGIEVDIEKLALSDKQVRELRDAGARTTNASFTWDDIEQPIDGGADADADIDAGPDADAAGGGTYIFNAGIHIVNLVLGTNDVRASLAIAAVDATGPRVPPDLAGRALDDVTVTDRYDVVTDYVFSQLPDLKLDSYLVAVDADLSLGNDAAKWAAFAGFVSKVGAHARTKRADLKVGFVLTGAALVEKKDLVAAALAASDVVVVSQPSSFDAVVAAAPPGKPVYVHRTALDAGDAFTQWDRHADRIPIVVFPSASADVVREARVRGF
jgi:hypothetical protein